MIVDLANEACEYIQEIDKLSIIKTEAEAIKVTLTSLQTVIAIVNQLSACTLVIGQKLPFATQEKLRMNCEYILRDISISSGNFEREPRQTQQLSSIKTRLQNIMKEVSDQWQRYATEQVREPLELLKLVTYLPEVAEQEELYRNIQAKLLICVNELPMQSEQLAAFEEYLQQLVHLLNRIEGLSPEVKSFLQKTINGQATLLDLTDEVLTWCRQGKHAQTFAITFAR